MSQGYEEKIEQPVVLLSPKLFQGTLPNIEALKIELAKRLEEEKVQKRAEGKRPRASGVSFRKRLKRHFNSVEKILP